MNGFDIVGPKAVRDGVMTDACFERTEATLRRAGKNPRVIAKMTTDQFPDGNFGLFAGVKDAVELLVSCDISVDAILEGILFNGDPVMRIEGDYLEFARLKTLPLGFLSHTSGCAMAVLETRLAAPDSTALSFSARHVHPAIAAIVRRNAFVAGLDGSSHVAAGKTLGKGASGMMSHTLLITLGRGNRAEAFRTFGEAVDGDVPRVALCDAYGGETEEVLQVVEAFGDDLGSVRLSTTSSYHGDSHHIVREVRWEPDAHGHEDVGISVSDGPGPAELRHFRDVVEDFGVDDYILDIDPVGFALGIVEVDGGSATKWDKLSNVKEVYRTANGNRHAGLRGRPSSTNGESLLEPLTHSGEAIFEFGFDIDATAIWTSEDTGSIGFGGVSEE